MNNNTTVIVVPSANDAPTEVAGHTFEAERRLAATNRAHAVVV